MTKQTKVLVCLGIGVVLAIVIGLAAEENLATQRNVEAAESNEKLIYFPDDLNCYDNGEPGTYVRRPLQKALNLTPVQALVSIENGVVVLDPRPDGRCDETSIGDAARDPKVLRLLRRCKLTQLHCYGGLTFTVE